MEIPLPHGGIRIAGFLFRGDIAPKDGGDKAFSDGRDRMIQTVCALFLYFLESKTNS